MRRTALLTLVVPAALGELGGPPIRAQPLPARGEIRLNSFTNGNQHDPATTADALGRFVVVWTSEGQDASGNGVFARRFSATGASLVSPEFAVNTFTTGDQHRPSAAAEPGGNVLVVWQSAGQDGSGDGIFARGYGADGTPLAPEQQVNAFTTGDQRRPAVSRTTDGTFVVAWESVGQDGSGDGVFARLVDAQGTPVGAEFPVNGHTVSDQRRPVVAAHHDGRFVIAWESFGQDGSGDGVYARRFGSTGVPLDGEFRVNTTTAGGQRRPAVATNSSGGFFVVWQSADQDGSGEGIFGQRYDAEGTAQGPEFSVNTRTTGDQRLGDIADGGDGHVVVVWQSAGGHDGSGIGVFGQRFALDGTPEGREFRVNTFTAGHQERPSMAMLGDGSFVVAWQSTRQDGSADGVVAQRFTLRAPLAGRLLVVRDGSQPTRRKIVVSSADPYFAASLQMGLDPVSDGLYLHVFGTVDGAEDSACMPLPASGWTARGDVFRPAYRYTDRAGLHGPCHAASLRNGRLKVACRAKQHPITYSLDEPAQVRVHAHLKSATATYCADFGGAVLRDSAVLPVFRAAFAQAPEACTTPPTPCP